MFIEDKKDKVFIPQTQNTITANDYNQIKNEIQNAIELAGMTPEKDVIQLPQALKTLTQQSGAEEVAKIEAAGQEQLNSINTTGQQAVQSAQSAANTATSKAAEAADSAAAANSASGAATSKANAAAASAAEAETAKTDAQSAQTAAEAAKTAAQSAKTAAESAKTQAAASATSASQSAIDAANSAAAAKGLQIGSVYFSQSNLATDNPGALPLWTGEYYSNASSLYPDFYSWVKSHTELCKTKQQYDDAVNTYGECPYYVIDEVSGSLRLPKLANYLKMAGTTGITQGKAGLPNITGHLYRVRVGDFAAFGALSESYQVGATSQTMANVINQQDIEIRFNASNSNGIYGASDTVTPAHTTLYPWIYAFNSAVSASVAQAAEFTESLTGKAATDLSNVSWEDVTPTVAFLQKGFKVCLPDLSNGYIDIAENTPYTCPQDGWVWTQGYFTYAGGQIITASVNDNALPNIGYNASNTYNFDSPQWFPVAKGDVWQCNRTSRFYGLRG